MMAVVVVVAMVMVMIVNVIMVMMMVIVVVVMIVVAKLTILLNMNLALIQKLAIFAVLAVRWKTSRRWIRWERNRICRFLRKTGTQRSFR